jgi:hypothetical protein
MGRALLPPHAARMTAVRGRHDTRTSGAARLRAGTKRFAQLSIRTPNPLSQSRLREDADERGMRGPVGRYVLQPSANRCEKWAASRGGDSD